MQKPGFRRNEPTQASPIPLHLRNTKNPVFVVGREREKVKVRVIVPWGNERSITETLITTTHLHSQHPFSPSKRKREKAAISAVPLAPPLTSRGKED